MSISNDVLSSTLYSIRDEAVDELYRKTAFLDHAKRCGGIEYEDGGSKIQRPLMLAEGSSITALPTGYEPVSLAVTDVMQPAVYDWSDLVIPIVITRKDEAENKGDKAIVKILETRFKGAMGQLRRAINQQILAGNNAVSITAGLLSLNGVAGATYFLENQVFGSGTNVVGGISKATYAAANWQNQRDTAASAYGTNGLVASDRLSAAMMSYGGETDVVIMSVAGFANYKRTLQTNERYVDQKVLDGGRMVLAWGGAVVDVDTFMPINTGVLTNEFTAYFLDFAGIKLIVHSDLDFKVSEMISVPGTTAKTADIYFKGQLVADHLASQGVLVLGDTY